MSSEPGGPSWLTERDHNELRERVAVLEHRLEQAENTISRLTDLEAKIGQGEASGVDASWLAIIDAAERMKDSPNNRLEGENRVQLFREDIMDATGKSNKQSGLYMEWFGLDDGKHAKAGTEYQPYEHASALTGGKAVASRLIIDLGVWGGGE